MDQELDIDVGLDYFIQPYNLPDKLAKLYCTPAFAGDLGWVLNQLDTIRPLRMPKRVTYYQASDKGLATLCGGVWSDVLRYCVEEKSWYAYDLDKHVWIRDVGDTRAFQCINAFTEGLKIHAKVEILRSDSDSLAPDLKTLEPYLKEVRSYDSHTKATRLLKATQIDLAISVKDFDSQIDTINCGGRIFDLNKGRYIGEVQPNDLYRLTTRTTSAVLDDKYKQMWEEFLDDICESDTGKHPDKKRYLQRACACALFGSNPEEKMFILFGATGRNGKGVFTNTLMYALKDYAYNVSSGLIVDNGKLKNRDANAANPMLAEAVNRRFLNMSETARNERIDAAAVKSLTGRDPIAVRKLYCEPYIVTPQFTMFMSCNTLPRVNDTTVFTADRLRVIPFEHHHTKAEIDPHLKRKFACEDMSRVVLDWLLEGVKDYLKVGLDEPECILEATDEYKYQTDYLGEFIKDAFTEDATAQIPYADIDAIYFDWCREKNYKAVSVQALHSSILEHGYHKYRTREHRGIQGLHPRPKYNH